MFSRAGAYEASIAFHQLAQLKPELVIPPLLERLYSALDTVTEPHRLTAALQCLVSVIRPLVSGGLTYPEGPSHVLPLLMACLPAIDPNDVRKTLVWLKSRCLESLFINLLTLWLFRSPSNWSHPLQL